MGKIAWNSVKNNSTLVGMLQYGLVFLMLMLFAFFFFFFFSFFFVVVVVVVLQLIHHFSDRQPP